MTFRKGISWKPTAFRLYRPWRLSQVRTLGVICFGGVIPLMSRRIERVNEIIREELSKLLIQGLKDPRVTGIVSITKVDTKPDLQHAKVYISILGADLQKRQGLEGLRSASGFLRRALRPQLSLRTIPHLQFILDDSIEQGAHILDVIRQLSAEENSTDV